MDRQCPSCGGFCKKSGCERENVKPKEWVGLTDEEIIIHFQAKVDTGSLLSFTDGVRYAESTLKEKNNG